MSKTVDGVLTQQIWDGDNIVAEANDANAILRSYTWGHQLLTDDDRRAYMYDGHGNIVQQNRGTTAESITRYDAYGNKVESSNVNDVPFGYCGEYLDSESGLIYLRNRYYDSESGIFITEDPIRDGINWYAYCSGNPVMFADPSGLKTERFGEFLEQVSKIVSKNKTISEWISKIDFKSFTQQNGTTVWYTEVDCWQRLFGYCNIYDEVADALPVFNIITKKFYFTYGSTQYRLQFWKGRYGPGIGCEVGIYENIKEKNVLGNTMEDLVENKYNDEYYRAYSKEMPMSITLRDSSTDRIIFQRTNVNTWWLNGFIADDASLDDLTMDASITFPNTAMAAAFTQSVIEARNSYSNRDFTINSYKNEVNITWASKNFTDANYGK